MKTNMGLDSYAWSLPTSERSMFHSYLLVSILLKLKKTEIWLLFFFFIDFILKIGIRVCKYKYV